MYCLVIDKDRCVNCGNCEASLPKLLEEAVDGKLLISPSKFQEVSVRTDIAAAIASCHVDALTLEEPL